MNYQKEYEKLNKEYKKLLSQNEKNIILINKMDEEVDTLLTNIKILENTVLDLTSASKKCAENIEKFRKKV